MSVSAKPKSARHWEREPDNWYVEPDWVTRRLCEVEAFRGRTLDPCAGMGNTIRGARDAGVEIEGYDLRDRGYRNIKGGHDFFDHPTGLIMPSGPWCCDNIISNPPYGRNLRGVEGERPRLEEQFLSLALERARSKVALFLQSGWLNGAERGAWLQTLPLYRVYMVGPRPSCPPGHMIAAGHKPGNGTGDYAWFVFLRGYEGAPTVHWLRRDG